MTARKNRMPTAKDATAKSPVRIYFADYFDVHPAVELRDGRQCRAGASAARGRRDVGRFAAPSVALIRR